MDRQRRAAFIDFSLTPSWSSPRALWEYIWTVYRIAEPQKKRTHAGDAFVALMRATEEEADFWTFTGDAIAIKRRKVYDIVEPYVAKPNSNYLYERKPPHKFFRRLALNSDPGFAELVFAVSDTSPESWSWSLERFKCDPRNSALLQQHFTATDPHLEFKGFPLIGWTEDYVWFGVTRFRNLWLQSSDVRACALEYPLIQLPEILKLRWSPVPDDWAPGSGWNPESGNFTMDREKVAVGFFSSCGDWIDIPDWRSFGRRITTPTADGPEILTVASSEDDLRLAAQAVDEYRHEHIFGSVVLVTPVSAESIANVIHVVQAGSDHPVRFLYLSDNALRRYARHFPWLFSTVGEPFSERLCLRGESLPEQLLLTCFIEAWRILVEFPSTEVLRTSWYELGLTDPFDTLHAELIANEMLAEDINALLIEPFGERLPTRAPYTQLADRVENWLVAHPRAKDLVDRRATTYISARNSEEVWRNAVLGIAKRSQNPDIRLGQIARPFRAIHALESYIECFPSDDNALTELAIAHLAAYDCARGIALLNQLLPIKGMHAIQHALTVATVNSWANNNYSRTAELLKVGFTTHGAIAANVYELLISEYETSALHQLTAHSYAHVRSAARAAAEKFATTFGKYLRQLGS